jgi:hypothetical protein
MAHGDRERRTLWAFFVSGSTEGWKGRYLPLTGQPKNLTRSYNTLPSTGVRSFSPYSIPCVFGPKDRHCNVTLSPACGLGAVR